MHKKKKEKKEKEKRSIVFFSTSLAIFLVLRRICLHKVGILSWYFIYFIVPFFCFKAISFFFSLIYFI